MRERNAATFGSFVELSDFYGKEDDLDRLAGEKRRRRGPRGSRAGKTETGRVIELLDESKLAAKEPGTAPGGPYTSLFLPGSPRRTRIDASMKAFDDFEKAEAARRAAKEEKAARAGERARRRAAKGVRRG